MGRRCVVNRCDNKDWEKRCLGSIIVMFHRIPTNDPVRMKQWLVALNIDPDTPTEIIKKKKVCSAHFVPDDYFERLEQCRTVRLFLKDTAIPSVGLTGQSWTPVAVAPEPVTTASSTAVAGPSTSTAADIYPEILEASRQYPDDTQNTSLEVQRKADFAAAPQQREMERRSANKPQESAEEDFPSIEVSLETDTEAFRKNIGVMTRPCVKDFGTNTDVLSKNWNLHVARDCLLQLFEVCGICGFETNARIEEEIGRFSVIQECQICSHQREWWSHSPIVETEVKETVKSKPTKKPKKADSKNKKQDLEDVCTLTMEFTSELFECDVVSDEEDMPSDDEEMLSDDDKVPEESSDEWCPSDEENEPLLDSDSSENSELDAPSKEREESGADMKLVEWCVDCAEESKLTCTTQRHKKLHACGMCVREEAVGFDKYYMRFDDLEGFLEHVKGEHDYKRRPLCTECGVLAANHKSHTCEHKLKKYICLDCGKRCISKRGLLIHKGQHHRLDRTHPCKFCLKSFQTKLDKHNHEKNHKAKKRPYGCSECSEKFSSIQKRNGHLRTHGKLKRHLCLTCLKEFRNCTKLERHMLVHTGEKPFVCEVCQRSFNQESHLSSHMRIHTGELPFTCPQCGKGFNHNVSLKNHIQRYHNLESSSKDQEESQEADSMPEPECDDQAGGKVSLG